MFSVQFITNFTVKTLFWEAEIFFKMCSQNAGNAISETPILKISIFHLSPPQSLLKYLQITYMKFPE
jgi:hypothetical protein